MAQTRLAREMGLMGLVATGVCSMVGAGINVIPFMIQRNVPGIASGGVISTLHDLARWGDALFTPGRVLPAREQVHQRLAF